MCFFKLMLDKNKKFRVIEEGVMNQGEMGVIKGGCLPCAIYGCPDTKPDSYSSKPCKCLVTCTDTEYHVCLENVSTYWVCKGTYTSKGSGERLDFAPKPIHNPDF